MCGLFGHFENICSEKFIIFIVSKWRWIRDLAWNSKTDIVIAKIKHPWLQAFINLHKYLSLQTIPVEIGRESQDANLILAFAGLLLKLWLLC